MMNEIECCDPQPQNSTTQTKVNSELLAHLHTGASNPEAIARYEAELLEISNRVVSGDLSDMEAILSSQVVSLNDLSARFFINADVHAVEGHVNEAEKYARMANNCVDRTIKAIAQLQKLKAPKKGSVYIRTLNQQNIQTNNSKTPRQF